MTSFALFDTAIGPCAIVWGEKGVVGVSLPRTDVDTMKTQIMRRHEDAEEASPPADVRRAIDAIGELLDGEKRDLDFVDLDMEDVEEFERKVYAIARKIPPGETKTYGDIARELGDLALSRSVGQALGQNPFPIVVPCHRVLGSNGKPGGFSATGGVETKIKMLNIERAKTSGEAMLFDDLPLEIRR